MGCLRDGKGGSSGGESALFGCKKKAKRVFAVTLPNGLVLNGLTYEQTLDYVQEFDGCTVEEICTEA